MLRFNAKTAAPIAMKFVMEIFWFLGKDVRYSAAITDLQAEGTAGKSLYIHNFWVHTCSSDLKLSRPCTKVNQTADKHTYMLLNTYRLLISYIPQYLVKTSIYLPWESQVRSDTTAALKTGVKQRNCVSPSE